MDTTTAPSTANRDPAEHAVAERFREATGVEHAFVYRPHPDGGYVLRARAGSEPSSVQPPTWVDGEGSNLPADVLPVTLGPAGRAGLVLLGPTRRQRLRGRLARQLDAAWTEIAHGLDQERLRRARAEVQTVLDLLGDLPPGRSTTLETILHTARDRNQGRATNAIEAARLELMTNRRRRGRAPRAHQMITLAALAEAHDVSALHTIGHSGRVVRVAQALALELDLPSGARTTVGTAARIHEVGRGILGAMALDAPDPNGLVGPWPPGQARVAQAVVRAVGLDRAVADTVGAVRAGRPGRPEETAATPATAEIVSVAEAYERLLVAGPWSTPLKPAQAVERISAQVEVFDRRVVAALQSVVPRLDRE